MVMMKNTHGENLFKNMTILELNPVVNYFILWPAKNSKKYHPLGQKHT